jgi:hypothetical protein
MLWIPSGSSGYWDMRVFQPGNNNNYIDVAQIGNSLTAHENIVTAQQVGEEGYVDATDPRLIMSFDTYNPYYLPRGTTNWLQWPASPSLGGPPAGSGYGVRPNNYESVVPSSECPGGAGNIYGENQDEQADPREWWTGSGGAQCSTNPQF